MIELAQHIETLLLENDCVIVPGLGGFVAHYTSATRMAEESSFLPPARVIGFNPQLKMNDGILVQSYMAVYDTDFPDATRIVEKEVADILAELHENGRMEIPNIGELRYSIHGTYDFIPYDHKLTTPYLYGLGSFEMQELAELKKNDVEKTASSSIPVAAESGKRKFEIKFNRSYLSNAAAMIAMIALFFLSAPIENTEVVEGNYAQLLPNELFEMIEKESLAINPIVTTSPANASQASVQQKQKEQKTKKAVAPVAVKEVKVSKADTQETNKTDAQAAPTAAQPKPQIAEAPRPKETPRPTVSAKRYHIIVASVGTEKDAKAMAKQLAEKGYPYAQAIIGNGKMRVSVESHDTEAEAYQALNNIRQTEAYKSAWVLKI